MHNDAAVGIAYLTCPCYLLIWGWTSWRASESAPMFEMPQKYMFTGITVARLTTQAPHNSLHCRLLKHAVLGCSVLLALSFTCLSLGRRFHSRRRLPLRPQVKPHRYEEQEKRNPT